MYQKTKNSRLGRLQKTKKTTGSSRTTSRLNFKLSTIAQINLVALVVLIGGIFGYVVQIALSTSHGYIINDLRSERLVHNNEVAKAEQHVQELRSTGHVSEVAQHLNMVVAEQAEFLPPLSAGVALR